MHGYKLPINCTRTRAAREAKPIVTVLEGVPTALRFVLENPRKHMGFVTASMDVLCADLCALAFGKREDHDVCTTAIHILRDIDQDRDHAQY